MNMYLPKKKKDLLSVSAASDIDETMTKKSLRNKLMYQKNNYDFISAAIIQQYLEKEEERDAKEHAMEYKRECDALRNQLREQKKTHELEITRLEARYKAEINRLKMERNKLAQTPSSHQASLKSDNKELKLCISEVAAHVKERFSKPGAEEVSTMLYHFAMIHDGLNKETFKLIDGIVPAVIQRDKPQQTVEIPHAGQVNINPQQVINRAKKDGEV